MNSSLDFPTTFPIEASPFGMLVEVQVPAARWKPLISGSAFLLKTKQNRKEHQWSGTKCDWVGVWIFGYFLKHNYMQNPVKKSPVPLPWICITFYSFTHCAFVPLSHTKSEKQLCGDSQAGTKPQAGSGSEIQGFGRKQWETTKRKGSLTYTMQDKRDTKNQIAATAKPL